MRVTCRPVIVALVASLGACSDGAAATARVTERHCDGADAAAGEATTLFAAAEQWISGATEGAPGRPADCAELFQSFAAGDGFVRGYNRLLPAVAEATGAPLLPIGSHVGGLSEVHALCLAGKVSAARELLATAKREVVADFERQLADCRTRGWRASDERAAAPTP